VQELLVSMRILIVDQSASFRSNLARYLGLLDTEYEVVGEAATDEFAVALTRRLLPDIVLLDIDLPDRNGIQTTRYIRRSWPLTTVIAITGHLDGEYRRAALDAGATECIDKLAIVDELPEVLATAARAVASRAADRAVDEPLELPSVGGAGRHADRQPSGW
jgi:DNA-binding NarL/FixJ family response regulator